MKEIVIPKTELKVSALCLGGGPHGVDPEESEKVLDYYLASGGNFIDTANIYGQWKPGGGVSVSERFLGKYIKSRKCRNRIVLDTKGAAPHFDTMHVPRVSRKDILHDIDDSLKNLQVDYVDLYWLHHDDEKISVEEIIDTLVDLVREGKIRYFGCSNWNTARIREALDYSRKKKIPEFVGNQVMYNLAKYNQERLDQEIMFGMTSEMYALHKKEGLAVMCYSSQAQGYFSCADKEDFMENPVPKYFRLFPGNEVRLKHAYFIKCTDVIKDEEGNIVEIHATYDPETKSGSGFTGRKVKGTIHWVDATHNIPADFHLYEPLLIENEETEGLPFLERINKNSEEVVQGFVEENMKDVQAHDKFQFFRHGYFNVDPKRTKDGKLSFNRIVSLKSSFRI